MLRLSPETETLATRMKQAQGASFIALRRWQHAKVLDTLLSIVGQEFAGKERRVDVAEAALELLAILLGKRQESCRLHTTMSSTDTQEPPNQQGA